MEFVLAARPAPAGRVRTVAAHPQASAQCRRWLRNHLPDAAVVDVLSNAAAAISAAEGEHDAAICAPSGPSRHQLTVLADKIADHPDAVTRFALVTRPARRRRRPATTSPRSPCTSRTTGSARCSPCSPSWPSAGST